MFPLSHFAPKYHLDKDGTITNLITGKPVVVSPRQYGWAVRLTYAGEVQVCYVHRLLAMQYLPKPEGANVVAFHDEDTLNIALHNLYWSSRSAVAKKMHSEGGSLYHSKVPKGTKEQWLNRILAGERIPAIAAETSKTPEAFNGLIRNYAYATGRKAEWDRVVYSKRPRKHEKSNITIPSVRKEFGRI